MSITIRFLLIASALLTLFYIMRRIYKSQMRIQDSIFWIMFSAVVLLMALFPGIIIGLTDVLGIASPVNFVFLVFIFFAYIRLFSMTIRIATLENKIKTLAYELAIRQKQENEEKKAAEEQRQL